MKEDNTKAESSKSALTVEQKYQLDQLLKKHEVVFKDPKGLPPKRVIKHDIQLVLDSPLSNLGLYKISMVESEEIKR